jgi:hypothetical protein
VHGAFADLARLAARLELGRDLLEELRPALWSIGSARRRSTDISASVS